jgi:DNA-binding Xre family transcriptional regulator
MKWKLKSYLEEHDLTPHQLALESKLSVNTIYPMARGKAARVSLQTLEKVAIALDKLTGKRVSVCDLLERE